VKRVLLTGMSGTGKSTLTRALAARGYKAVDLDEPGWSERVRLPGAPGPAAAPGYGCVWREDRVRELLATDDVDVLFVSGCASNQGQFYPQFDHVVLLSAPIPLMRARLATRTTNSYGKAPDELALVLHHKRTVEPRLRRIASLEVDTSAAVEQVLAALLDRLGLGGAGAPGPQ
jgi:dephospho-CoA kinase